MDNQSSPAQFLVPTIPGNFCPEGTWADIFNAYGDLYLSNATIDIPFLNQITPQQIQAISATILTLSNKQNAVNAQTGVSSVAFATVAGTPFVSYANVTFPNPIQNNNYFISGYFFIPASGVQSSYGATWQVVVGSKTTTGFTLRFCNESLDISQFQWQVYNLGALAP